MKNLFNFYTIIYTTIRKFQLALKIEFTGYWINVKKSDNHY